MKTYNLIMKTLQKKFYDVKVISYKHEGDSAEMKFSYTELHTYDDNVKITRTAKFSVTSEATLFNKEKIVVKLVSLL